MAIWNRTVSSSLSLFCLFFLAVPDSTCALSIVFPLRRTIGTSGQVRRAKQDPVAAVAKESPAARQDTRTDKTLSIARAAQQNKAGLVLRDNHALRHCLFPSGLDLGLRSGRGLGNKRTSKQALLTRTATVLATATRMTTMKRLFRIAAVAALARTVVASDPCVAAVAQQAVAGASTLPSVIGWKELVIAGGMITTVGGLSLYMRGLKNLASSMLVSCSRCSIQLYILGAVVLHRLLEATNPWIIMSWMTFISLVAARQGFARLEYSYDNLPLHFILAFWISGFSVLGFSLAFDLLGKMQPWFKPSVLLPVAGMIFGNTLSAVALGGVSLTGEFAKSQHMLELRLARGASASEAVLPLINAALTAALTPTLNSLAATGIINTPGMMTGQILAGQSPQQAAVYQTLILFLIASTACISVQVLAQLITGELMDKKGHRLKSYKLRKKDAQKERTPLPWMRSVLKSTGVMIGVASNPVPPEESAPLMDSLNSPSVEPLHNNGPSGQIDEDASALSSPRSSSLFEADRVVVNRAGLELTLKVGPGDRVGITGPSGTGKTQILRTLAGLEPGEGHLLIGGTTPAQMTWPTWRRRVCWVSQDRPASEDTPRGLYQEMLGYVSQTQQVVGGTNSSGADNAAAAVDDDHKKTVAPEEIAQRWGLDPDRFDRPWPTLSGGEAQRASLAIALALKPKVLLLDEVTSALDGETTLLVEQTLKETNVPIIMVTHSPEQLDRFCTHHLYLTKREEPTVAAAGLPPTKPLHVV